MTANETGPVGENGTGCNNNNVCTQDTTSGIPATNDTRPRCLRCGRPLTLPRSVSRAYGPRCWTRTAVAQLDRRRDHVGRGLGSLARRVARLDALGLALVAAWLVDVAEALDNAEGVAL